MIKRPGEKKSLAAGNEEYMWSQHAQKDSVQNRKSKEEGHKKKEQLQAMSVCLASSYHVREKSRHRHR